MSRDKKKLIRVEALELVMDARKQIDAGMKLPPVTKKKLVEVAAQYIAAIEEILAAESKE